MILQLHLVGCIALLNKQWLFCKRLCGVKRFFNGGTLTEANILLQGSREGIFSDDLKPMLSFATYHASRLPSTTRQTFTSMELLTLKNVTHPKSSNLHSCPLSVSNITFFNRSFLSSRDKL